MEMPKDSAMLLSLVNMKLRDGAPSPEELCEECGWDCAELYRRLASIGCLYDEEKNRFCRQCALNRPYMAVNSNCSAVLCLLCVISPIYAG